MDVKETEKEQKEEPGKKYDGGKARFDLLPPDALFELVKVFTRGAEKYDDRNWEKGMTWGRVFGAIQRHLWKFWRGETHDQDLGTHHLANAAWGCMVLMAYSMRMIGKDDRG